jgi:hypothetical protein
LVVYTFQVRKSNCSFASHGAQLFQQLLQVVRVQVRFNKFDLNNFQVRFDLQTNVSSDGVNAQKESPIQGIMHMGMHQKRKGVDLPNPHGLLQIPVKQLLSSKVMCERST